MASTTAESPALPKGWHRRLVPQGTEITYLPREGRGFIAAFTFSAIVTVLSAYGVYGFLKNWFIDKADILPGGVVLCLVLVGGLLFGFRNFRILFERISYTFGGSSLVIFRKKPLAAPAKVTIEKGSVKRIIQLYTPPKQQGEAETFRTCLVYSGSTSKDLELIFEGYRKDESDFMTEIVAAWNPSIERASQNTFE